MMNETDKEAFSINVRNELTICQSRLIADFTAVIHKHHETFMKDLVSQLNGSNLRACANVAEAVPPELCQVSVPQCREVLAAQDVTAKDQRSLEAESTDQSPKKPFRSQSMDAMETSVGSTHSHHDDDQSSEAELAAARENANFSSIFAASALGEQDLEEAHYHVEDFYSREGWAQRLARDERFSNITLAIIAFNAVYIGIDADWNSADVLFDAHPFFIFMDNAFCLFFSFELLVRFLAFKNKCHSFKDGWFKFDSFLVTLMVMETWVMAPIVGLVSGGGISIPVQPLRLLRLLRLTRMTRLLRSLPELVTMCKGMKIASRAVLSSLLMVVLLIYTFAIVLNMGLRDDDFVNDTLAPRNFTTIPRTMWTLLMDGTFMDNTGLVLTTLLFSGNFVCWMACLVFMAFILFSAITVMNMLIGVLCEVVSAVAQAEKDEADIALAKESILVELKKFCNDEGKIHMADLMHVFADKKSKVVLKSLNIDQLFLTELQQLLFPTPDSVVSIRQIMELMLMCRGDLPVTVEHIASQQATLFCSLQKLEQRLTHQLHELRHLPLFATQSTSILEKIAQTEQPHVCVLAEDVNVEPSPIEKVLAQEGVNVEPESISKALAQEDLNVEPLPTVEVLAQADVNAEPSPVGKMLPQENMNVEPLPLGEALAWEDVNAEPSPVGKTLAQEDENVEHALRGKALAQEDVHVEHSLVGQAAAQEDVNVEHASISKASAQEDVHVEPLPSGEALAQENVNAEPWPAVKGLTQDDVNVEHSSIRQPLVQDDANVEHSAVGKVLAQEVVHVEQSSMGRAPAQEDVHVEHSSMGKAPVQEDVNVEPLLSGEALAQEDVNAEPWPVGKTLAQVDVKVDSSPIEVGSCEDYLTPEDTPRQTF